MLRPLPRGEIIRSIVRLGGGTTLPLRSLSRPSCFVLVNGLGAFLALPSPSLVAVPAGASRGVMSRAGSTARTVVFPRAVVAYVEWHRRTPGRGGGLMVPPAAGIEVSCEANLFHRKRCRGHGLTPMPTNFASGSEVQQSRLASQSGFNHRG